MNVEPGSLGVITPSRADPGEASGSCLLDDAPSEEGSAEESLPAGDDVQPGPGPGRPGHAPSGPLLAWRVRAWVARRRRPLTGWLVLIVVFAVSTATRGIPISEDTVLIWLAAALFVASLDDLGRWRRGVVRDWLPLYLVLVLYTVLRGYASHVLWGPFISPQLAFDRFIGLGTLPTVRLQQLLFNPYHLHVWDYAAWAVYTSHFFASYTVAAVLWKRNHERFKRYIALFVGLTFVGYVGYVLYPAMPPWMASQAGHAGYGLDPAAFPPYMATPTGYAGTTTRIIPVVWQNLGMHSAAALFTHGSAFANDVAAMPSLHAAYPMLMLLFFWRRARRSVRALLIAYVLAMAFTLVYAGEHFVIDELVGWLCAAIVYFAGSKLLDLRDARRGWARAPAEPARQPADVGGNVVG